MSSLPSSQPSRRRGLRRRKAAASRPARRIGESETDTQSPRRFQDLYDQHWDDLHRYCQRRCASTADADDVLAETFTIAWRRLADIPTGAAARPWLFVVARNLLSEHYRRGDWVRSVTERVAADLRTGATVPIPGRNDSADQLEVTVQALMELDEPDRELIQLLAWDGLSHADAAAVLGCTSNAIAIRLSRARTKLKAKTDEIARIADSDVGPVDRKEIRRNLKGSQSSSHVRNEEPRSEGGNA